MIRSRGVGSHEKAASGTTCRSPIRAADIPNEIGNAAFSGVNPVFSVCLQQGGSLSFFADNVVRVKQKKERIR